MKSDTKQPWIACGYEIFSKEGPKGLKVEVIANRVKKSKSSFYHHFANIDIFTKSLLDYHLERAKIIAQRERLCANVVPELLNLILEIKQDLLFNRQLRVNRDNPQFKHYFEKASKDVGEAILGIWADALELKGRSGLAMLVLNLSLENFYLQITEEVLTYDWLVRYVGELKAMVKEFKKVKFTENESQSVNQ